MLAERPSGLVDESTVRLESEAVPDLADGEALVRVRYLSIDPTIRTWMDDVPSYLPPIQIGEVIRSGGVGEVIDSRSEAYTPGQLLFGMTGWQDYVVVDAGERAMQVLPDGVPPGIAIGILGVTGMTAYFGITDVGQVKAGDVVVVSGAAGATGSAAGQIAKIKGAKKVVGIAGGAEKCAFIVDELGFDDAIDYKNDNVAATPPRDLPGRHRPVFRQCRRLDPQRLPRATGAARAGCAVWSDLHLQQRRTTAGTEQLPEAVGQPRADGGLHHPRLPRPFPGRSNGGRGVDRRRQDQVLRAHRRRASNTHLTRSTCCSAAETPAR